jgi:hypothetical protein
MKQLLKNFVSLILTTMFLCGLLITAGCDGGDFGKAATETVKKAVGNEVTKKSDEMKKQFDQIFRPGSDNKKDRGEKSSEGGSENKSGEESGKEND